MTSGACIGGGGGQGSAGEARCGILYVHNTHAACRVRVSSRGSSKGDSLTAAAAAGAAAARAHHVFHGPDERVGALVLAVAHVALGCVASKVREGGREGASPRVQGWMYGECPKQRQSSSGSSGGGGGANAGRAPRPKSVMRTCPSPSSKTFSGLRSLHRWGMGGGRQGGWPRAASAARWRPPRRRALRLWLALQSRSPARHGNPAQPDAPVHEPHRVQVRDRQHYFGAVQTGQLLVKRALPVQLQVGRDGGAAQGWVRRRRSRARGPWRTRHRPSGAGPSALAATTRWLQRHLQSLPGRRGARR